MKRSAIVQAYETLFVPILKELRYGCMVQRREVMQGLILILILILVNGDTLSLEDEMKITKPLYRIELETGILINTFIILNKKWGTIVTPFYENVMKERIAL